MIEEQIGYKFSIKIEGNKNIIGIPVSEEDVFQLREDGILLKGKLYLFEEIKYITIENLQYINDEPCGK